MSDADDRRHRVNLFLHSVTATLLLICVVMQLVTAPQLFQAARDFREERQAWHEQDRLIQAARQRTLNLQVEYQAQAEENLRIAREIDRAKHRGEP